MFARGVIATLLACLLITSTGEMHSMAHAKVASKTPESSQQAAPLVEQYLLTGRLSEGEQALKSQLVLYVSDDQARLGHAIKDCCFNFQEIRLAQQHNEYNVSTSFMPIC